MCPADKEVFSSFAHAQVSITNEIYQYLGEPETFLFCPTGTYTFYIRINHTFTQLFYLTIYSLFVCSFALKSRVLWNILLPKCLSVPLSPYSRREATTWH